MARNSQNKQAESSAAAETAPTAMADPVADLKAQFDLKTADELTAQPPASPAEDGPQAAPEQSIAKRVRPTGPKPRAPGEPGSVFTSVAGGFRLTEDGAERTFAFSDANPPTSDEKEAMRNAGMAYRGAPRKHWAAPATPQVREATDALALKFSGKRDRIDESRGR